MMEELPSEAFCSKRDLGRSSGLPPGHLAPRASEPSEVSHCSRSTDPTPWPLRTPWGLALACRQPLPHSGSLRSSLALLELPSAWGLCSALSSGLFSLPLPPSVPNHAQMSRQDHSPLTGSPYTLNHGILTFVCGTS